MSKCCMCRKKLLTTKCKCGKYVCLKHRFPDLHQCAFDYKTCRQKRLQKEMPKIIPDKIQKI